MKTKILAIAGALAASFTASGAQAAACTGAPPFTDVSASASYCTNTEWLKNRAVTTGCVGTNFCPNDVVTRASMALFMNRLADALVRPPIRVEDAPGAYTLTTGAVDNIQCQANVLTAANYPRSIALSTHLTALASGQATMGIQPLYSTDGGATWNFPNTFAERVGFDSIYEGNVSSPATFTLPAGLPLRVGVGPFSFAGATGIASGGRCHILVQAQSVSGSSSPFDEADVSTDRRPDGF
jgi:hypothetical protein